MPARRAAWITFNVTPSVSVCGWPSMKMVATGMPSRFGWAAGAHHPGWAGCLWAWKRYVTRFCSRSGVIASWKGEMSSRSNVSGWDLRTRHCGSKRARSQLCSWSPGSRVETARPPSWSRRASSAKRPALPTRPRSTPGSETSPRPPARTGSPPIARAPVINDRARSPAQGPYRVSTLRPGRVEHLLDRLLQQGPAAEPHSERLQFVGDDLVLRRRRRAPDGGSAPGKLPGDRGDLVLGDVAIVAIVRLARDVVGRVDLLAPSAALDVLAPGHRADQVEPLARAGRVGQAVDARRAQGADREAQAEPVAVHERFERGLVGAVVAGRPERVRLVERAVAEDLLVHGAGRDENEPADACLPRRLDQVERPHDIPLDELE